MRVKRDDETCIQSAGDAERGAAGWQRDAGLQSVYGGLGHPRPLGQLGLAEAERGAPVVDGLGDLPSQPGLFIDGAGLGVEVFVGGEQITASASGYGCCSRFLQGLQRAVVQVVAHSMGPGALGLGGQGPVDLGALAHPRFAERGQQHHASTRSQPVRHAPVVGFQVHAKLTDRNTNVS